MISNSLTEQKTIDSIFTAKKFKDLKNLNSEFKTATTILRNKGYIDLNHDDIQKTNDSTYTSKLNLGKKYTHITIAITPYKELLNLKDDTLKIRFNEYEQEINRFLKTLEKKGHSLAQIKSTLIHKKENSIITKLFISKDTSRTITNINIKNYVNFPKNHLTVLRKTFIKKTFNNSTFKNIEKEVKEYPFCKELKPAEILFSKDSTSIYFFLDKRKTNSFDGFIGFNNLNNQFKINGYLDLKLTNTLNTGEKFNLFWKNDENKQKTFESSIELPYIFKSKFALKGTLNIFKQDSLFQRTKSEIELGYYFNYNRKIYIGYQETESSSLLEDNKQNINDFKNYFYILSYAYSKRNEEDRIYPYKNLLDIKIGYGYRDDSSKKQTQYTLNLAYEHTFKINNKNLFNLKSQNFVLLSDYYLTNELYRFGGINSIRGYRENSLQANFLSTLQSEYCYKLNQNFILHSVADIGTYKDNTLKNSGQLYGLGLGVYLLSKNSIINIVYATPKNNQQDFNLNNGLFQIKSKFNL